MAQHLWNLEIKQSRHRATHGQGGVGQKQVPYPCDRKIGTHKKISMVFSMVYPFFGQKSCTIFTVQILLLSI